MSQPTWIRVYRIAFALLGLTAVVFQFAKNSQRDPFNPVNFFSFFTIQSNILAAVVLLVAASGLAARPSFAWDMVRGAATMYMTTTGIVYGLLLSGLEESLQTPDPWVNNVLHRVMPLVMIADLLLRPLAHRITLRQALLWTVYPFVYLVYTLVRGPIVDWYPYPFLNPDEEGGYPSVAAYCVGILIGFLLFSALIIRVNQWRRDKDDIVTHEGMAATG